MNAKYIVLAALLQCFISGTENTESFNEFTEKLSKYSVVNPQVIHRTTRSINKSQTIKEEHEDEVSYVLNINNRKHFLHLKKNRDFLHPNFVVYSGDAVGNSSFPGKRVHCYYHGEVEGYENSLVALSTCSGLRGVIVLGNETFGLEPVPRSASNDHLLYKLEDAQSEPATCGVVNEATSPPNHERFEPGQSLTSLLRRKRNLPETSYVELVLVVDNLRYNFRKQNSTAVRDEMVEMANLLDGYYKPLNIRIMLVGLEIFTDSNPFSVEGSAGDVLGRFVRWRRSTLFPKIRHDVAQLVVGRTNAYEGGVLGMAFVGTVCSVASAGGISVFSNDNLAYFSTVVAHEMGHNMGMNHDNNRCSCGGESCIMSASAGGSSMFSTCSGDDFERLVMRGGGACLRNPPSPSDVIGTAECGNGRLDEGEECDCGKPEECKNKCCDAATCKFTQGSVCADGACCDNCQIRVSGTPCRKSVNSCDLPEYCLGNSSFCPEDFYMMDGLPCENNAAYCYEGRCQTYNYQCKDIFSPDPARKADDICFRHANVRGDRFGNCGFKNGAYIKCSVEHAKCGKLQCTNVDANKPPTGATVTNTVVNGTTCTNADFNLGPDVLDPAYSNPGSPCAKGKTCIEFQCVNASALLPGLSCRAETTCRGRGVCNDQGNCHCDNGWAPPSCVTSGRGGSINSGPAMIDHSLRNGLLIFFLLVVPVVVLVILLLLYFFRRDVFDPCTKGGKKPRNAQNNSTNPRSNGNQTHATVNFPGDATPDVLPGNHQTAGPASRYGEMDYWNTDMQEPPPRPPARVQGPGVPRPIPPRQ